MERPLINRPHALYVNGELVAIVTNPDPITGGLAEFIDALDDGAGVGVLPLDKEQLAAGVAHVPGVLTGMLLNDEDEPEYKTLTVYRRNGGERERVTTVQYSPCESDIKVLYEALVECAVKENGKITYTVDKHYGDEVVEGAELKYPYATIQQYERSIGVRSY